jgi:hypothetical protein
MRDKGLRERNWCKLSALKPVNGCRVDRYGLLRTDIRTILQVSVLTFLLCLQIKARETTEIFLHNSFVNCCTAPDALTIVVSHPVQIISLTMTKCERQ